MDETAYRYEMTGIIIHVSWNIFSTVLPFSEQKEVD